MKYEVHALGERLVVEQGADLGVVKVKDAASIAVAFRHGRVVTIPTTRGDVTFNVPDGGLPVWVRPIKSGSGPEQLI